jgi:hypothetical protein
MVNYIQKGKTKAKAFRPVVNIVPITYHGKGKMSGITAFLSMQEKVNSDIPVIETESKNIEVDLGTTIRLPCFVDNLPGRKIMS